ncbi:hypothetical protein X755_20420 [Mesorhizobium sp. LNJC405B00]|nr:hypothetical protein X755_20420 [Mesorhizobium sp. LNJC405B00]
MSEQPVVLSLELEAIPADGPSIPFKLEVQSPFLEREMQWRCVIRWAIFRGRSALLEAIPFKPYALAIDFARWTLRTFEESGGRLMCEGDRFPLEAYFFTPPA